MAKQEFHLDFCGRGITVETGEIAKQADGAMQQIMDIADSGKIMPPKATWFEPKLRSGLIIHKLD